MNKKIDGNINIKIDLEDDANYIKSLPPEEQKYAFRYWWKSTQKDFRLIHYSIEKLGKAILSSHGIDTLLDSGFNLLFRNLEHPTWPKSKEGWVKWREIYECMIKLDDSYREEKLKKPKPGDYADNIAATFGYFGNRNSPYKARALRDIKRAGKLGYLEKGKEGRLD